MWACFNFNCESIWSVQLDPQIKCSCGRGQEATTCLHQGEIYHHFKSVACNKDICLSKVTSKTSLEFWAKLATLHLICLAERGVHEKAHIYTGVNSLGENVTSDDQSNSVSPGSTECDNLVQSSGNDLLMELCLRAIRLQRLRGFVVRSQLFRYLLGWVLRRV